MINYTILNYIGIIGYKSLMQLAMSIHGCKALEMKGSKDFS